MLSLRLDPKLIDRLDHWREGQTFQLSRTAVIEGLIVQHLKAEDVPDQVPSRKKKASAKSGGK